LTERKRDEEEIRTLRGSCVDNLMVSLGEMIGSSGRKKGWRLEEGFEPSLLPWQHLAVRRGKYRQLKRIG